MKDASNIRVANRQNSEHYLWGERCHGWHLVRKASLSVIEERMPPGTTEVRHYHRTAQQFFFCLTGTAIMEIEGDMVELHRGDGVHVLPGMRHQISNQSCEPVEFLVISQPPSHGDRVNE